MKKWITNGVYRDIFTTAFKTDDTAGMFGISLLVIERNSPGFSVRQMKCGGLWASGTSFLVFENVKVPVENLIGKEGEGFRYIMVNFNHERLGILTFGIRNCRVLVNESIKFAATKEKLSENNLLNTKINNIVQQDSISQSF